MKITEQWNKLLESNLHALPTIEQAFEVIYQPQRHPLEEVKKAIQAVEQMFRLPGGKIAIPPEWWETEPGWAMLGAKVWADGDELITISKAAAMTGKRHDWFTHAVQRGRLQAYKDPHEPNPRRRTRILKSQVLGLTHG